MEILKRKRRIKPMFFQDKRVLYLILAIFIITGIMGMTQARIGKLTFNITSSINCNNLP